MSEYPEHLRPTRMKEDIEFITSPGQWPGSVICLKTQPWIEERRFGLMSEPEGSKYSVVVNDGSIEYFSSVEELVKVWSID